MKDPVYQQLNDLLRGLIRKGEFESGQQFLTERQVASRFDVSRATANKALSSLVSEGVLEFRKGVGTFVKEGVLDYDLAQLVSFTNKAEAAGKKPRTKVLAFRSVKGSEAEEGVASALEVSDDESLYYIERQRLADGEPVIYERRYVVKKHCPGLTRKSVNGSLYALWADEFELSIEGADEIIGAINVDQDQADRLGIALNVAALEVIAIGFIDKGQALWWEQTLYRSDAYRFHNRLAGLRQSGPAVGRLV